MSGRAVVRGRREGAFLLSGEWLVYHSNHVGASACPRQPARATSIQASRRGGFATPAPPSGRHPVRGHPDRPAATAPADARPSKRRAAEGGGPVPGRLRASFRFTPGPPGRVVASMDPSVPARRGRTSSPGRDPDPGAPLRSRPVQRMRPAGRRSGRPPLGPAASRGNRPLRRWRSLRLMNPHGAWSRGLPPPGRAASEPCINGGFGVDHLPPRSRSRPCSGPATPIAGLTPRIVERPLRGSARHRPPAPPAAITTRTRDPHVPHRLPIPRRRPGCAPLP